MQQSDLVSQARARSDQLYCTVVQKTSYLNISLCQIINCQKYFMSLIFVGPHPYENILTMDISRITVHGINYTHCTMYK